MSFAALRATSVEHDDYDTGPIPDFPDADVEPAAPELFPSDPLYCVSVFYDPEVIKGEAAFEKLYTDMQQEYPGRELYMRELNKGSMNYQRLSPFPESEARFLRNGYVTDIEGRVFDQGPVSHSRYAKRNIAALTVNAVMMSTFLNKHPITAFPQDMRAAARWRETWKMMAPVMGKLTMHQDERDAAIRAQERQPDRNPEDMNPDLYPLVEYRGLLVGTQAFAVKHTLHWAYEMTPLTAWFAGNRDYECDALFGSHSKEMKDQIKFEAKNVPYLFRPRLLNAALTDDAVTPAMITTWYSQAMAAIRKVCWLVTTEEEPSLAAYALHQEHARHGAVLGGADRLPPSAESWEQLIAALSAARAELIAETMPPVARDQTMTYKISWEQEILAGLMGATFDSHDEPGESPYSNPDIFTASLARWIGRLKRTRAATIDAWTADSILSFWDRSQDYEPLLLSQFPRTTWLCLVEIAEMLSANRDMPEVQVTYTWTRDRIRPYKCEDRNNVLALEGPLLCFPTLQADYWRAKAAVIAELEGFEL